MRLARIYQVDHQSPIHVQYALLDADAPTIPPPEAEDAAAATAHEPVSQEAEEE
jgi:hypothetical protein